MRWLGCLLLILILPLSRLPIAAAGAHPHVVVILDASGSMQQRMQRGSESRLAVATRALTTVLAEAPPDLRLGVAAFGGGVAADGWVLPLSVYDPAALARSLRPLRPAGKTPLGKFMDIGARALLQARRAAGGYGTYRLLIVTDGAASDPGRLAAVLPQAISCGLQIEVIGLDMQVDHPLAQDVHRYRHGQDEAGLRLALGEAFAEIPLADGDDAVGQQHFALLAGLPDAVARAALTALATPADSLSAAAVPALARAPAPAPAAARAPAPVLDPAAEAGASPLRSYGRYLPVAIFIFILLVGVLTRIGRR